MIHHTSKSRRQVIVMEESWRPTVRASNHENPDKGRYNASHMWRNASDCGLGRARSHRHNAWSIRSLTADNSSASSQGPETYVGRPARHRLGAGFAWRMGGLARCLRPRSVGIRFPSHVVVWALFFFFWWIESGRLCINMRHPLISGLGVVKRFRTSIRSWD